MRAFLGKCLRWAGRSVPDCELMSRIQDVYGNARSHSPETNEPDFHYTSPLTTWCVCKLYEVLRPQAIQIRNTGTGSLMFFTVCSPMASKPNASFFSTSLA